jgi:hypothetical protein
VSRKRQVAVSVAVVAAVVVLGAVVVGSFAPTGNSGPPEGLGEVDGIAYNASLSITVDDGLNESELDALVARSMARIEVIRGLAFEKRVDVEVITREEYSEGLDSDLSAAERTWENLRWEALFVVGEDRDALAVLEEVFAGGVQGYYSAREEQIVIVSDADRPAVDTETLVHELVHALQDQRFGLGYDGTTTDAREAYESVIEGEAELVPERYFDRCDGDWSCVRLDGETGDTDDTDLEAGIRLRILAPYVEGREFVEQIRQDGGWDAVDGLHDRPPASSSQVIHPDSYPDSEPTLPSFTDRSSDEWRPLGETAETSGTDTLGEAAIYAMLLHNDVVSVDEPLAYEHPFSEGWAGDRLVPYEREGKTGYVWETAWETPEDAEQFASAYQQILEERGAVGTGENSFVIPSGSFDGAFRVTRDGTAVRIVHAPTSDALGEISP